MSFKTPWARSKHRSSLCIQITLMDSLFVERCEMEIAGELCPFVFTHCRRWLWPAEYCDNANFTFPLFFAFLGREPVSLKHRLKIVYLKFRTNASFTMMSEGNLYFRDSSPVRKCSRNVRANCNKVEFWWTAIHQMFCTVVRSDAEYVRLKH